MKSFLVSIFCLSEMIFGIEVVCLILKRFVEREFNAIDHDFWPFESSCRSSTHPAFGFHDCRASIAGKEIQKLLGLGVSVMG